MHYEDIWEKDHRRKLETELNAATSRKQLLNILDSTQMLQIMFKGYLDKLHDNKVIELSKEYLKERNINEHKNSEVKIIEMRFTINNAGIWRISLLRELTFDSWKNYISEYQEYASRQIYPALTMTLPGGSVGGEKQISNLEFDEFQMACDIYGEFTQKHFGYLVQ